MKIRLIDDKIILYLKQNQIDVDFKNISKLEDYFKNLFRKLKRLANIILNGFYNIDIYLDRLYGAIIEIKKEEIEYLEYEENQIDMHITIHDTTILYEIEDILDIKQDEYIYYLYKGKYYLYIDNIKEKISILELTNLVYKTEDIIMYGKKIGKMI